MNEQAASRRRMPMGTSEGRDREDDVGYMAIPSVCACRRVHICSKPCISVCVFTVQLVKYVLDTCILVTHDTVCRWETCASSTAF